MIVTGKKGNLCELFFFSILFLKYKKNKRKLFFMEALFLLRTQKNVILAKSEIIHFIRLYCIVVVVIVI
jgi:hypothetical protein